MASAQMTGTYSIYVVNPQGERKLVKTAQSQWWSPGGSPDGAPANTPEKWNYLPPSQYVGGPGYRLVFEYTPGRADTLDASDGFMQIPINVNGNDEFVGNDDAPGGIGNDNFVVDTSPSDQVIGATLVGQPQVYQVLRAKEGVNFRVGGGRVNWSIEDDTA